VRFDDAFPPRSAEIQPPMLHVLNPFDVLSGIAVRLLVVMTGGVLLMPLHLVYRFVSIPW
jgi:hypothetical protein